MGGSVADLSRYRLERAKEDLKTARDNFNEGSYRASVNRSYYAIFHALRAVTALDLFDSGKHSGIIAYVNQNYVKTGIFDKSFSKTVDSAFRLREKADYEDFYIVAVDDAQGQIEKAEQIIQVVEAYVKAKW
jgi:uncharacterized protein (UPF0332 family)